MRNARPYSCIRLRVASMRAHAKLAGEHPAPLTPDLKALSCRGVEAIRNGAPPDPPRRTFPWQISLARFSEYQQPRLPVTTLIS